MIQASEWGGVVLLREVKGTEGFQTNRTETFGKDVAEVYLP